MIRNSGVAYVDWQIENCSWLDVDPITGSSTNDVDQIMVNIDPTGIDGGYYKTELIVTDVSTARDLKVDISLMYYKGQITVPAMQPTIQAAIDASVDGNIIVVADGTHTGQGNRDIDFLGKKIIVESENGPENCIIDCQGSPSELHRGFIFQNDEDEYSVLDGLTITNAYQVGYGGGIFGGGNSPIIINCTLINNTARYGGGIASIRGPITNCDISLNKAYGSSANGGGLYWCEGPISNCTITGNKAQSTSSNGYASGGGLYYCHGLITDCMISSNSAVSRKQAGGSGLSNCYGSITNCIISSNISSGDQMAYGGGLRNCYGTISNCAIIGNIVSSEDAAYAGGLYYCTGLIINCTISGNIVDAPNIANGGGFNNCNGEILKCTISGNSDDGIYDCDAQISDCIIWGNGGLSINAGSPVVTYSDIEGGFPGLGNIDIDPNFVEPGYWDPNGTPEIGSDGFWVYGDYHLKSEGWRWDNDANNWTWDDVTSPCIDAGNPGALLGDEPITLDVDPLNRWGQNLRINMGAYGSTAEASMPPYDWAILADLTNDGIVNLTDFANQAIDWQNTAPTQSGDLNRDGTVNLNDALLMANDWLKTTTWY